MANTTFELTQKIEEIETTTKNKDNAIVSINKIKGEKNG
jgi:hypothetical protein